MKYEKFGNILDANRYCEEQKATDETHSIVESKGEWYVSLATDVGMVRVWEREYSVSELRKFVKRFQADSQRPIQQHKETSHGKNTGTRTQ